MHSISHQDQSLPALRFYEINFRREQRVDFSQMKYLPPLTTQHRRLSADQRHLCMQKTAWYQGFVFGMLFGNPSHLAGFPEKHCIWKPCFLTTFENHSQ